MVFKIISRNHLVYQPTNRPTNISKTIFPLFFEGGALLLLFCRLTNVSKIHSNEYLIYIYVFHDKLKAYPLEIVYIDVMKLLTLTCNLKSNHSPSTFGIVHYHYQGYQDENLKLVSLVRLH